MDVSFLTSIWPNGRKRGVSSQRPWPENGCRSALLRDGIADREHRAGRGRDHVISYSSAEMRVELLSRRKSQNNQVRALCFRVAQHLFRRITDLHLEIELAPIFRLRRDQLFQL